nr:MAG TPA: large terminase [Caudoviricetes sp.]
MLNQLDAETRRRGWAEDPAGWVKHRLGDHLWSKQVEIARNVAEHPRVAVKACHGPGKSFTASRIALWWIDAHPPGEAIVVSTAPTYAQVHAILWEEIRKAHRKGGLPGVVLKSDEWQDADGNIVGFGRKPADTDKHGFQGIHRRYVLVIIDEACGVPKQLFTAAEAIATNTDCRILAIGNPDDPGTEFSAVCKPGSGYKTITISAFDSPNFTGEPCPDYLTKLLVSPEWVEDKRKRWGEESPLWQSKVLGEFPEVSSNTLIRPGWITAAQNSDLPARPSPLTLGVDVARFGLDKTVICERRGPRLRIVRTIDISPTTQVAGEVVAEQRRILAETGHIPTAQVDTVGVGGGVADLLREQGALVADMVAGAGARDPKRFANARAEWYWQLRDLFEAGQIDLDPADDETAGQLAAIRYELTSKGQVKIESKDDMRARGVASPDRADALMLAVGTPPARRTGSDFYNYG